MKVTMPIILLLSTGPATWASKFPLAAGSRQSPVDIDTSKVCCVPDAAPLSATFDGVRGIRLVNPGYGWKVEVDGQSSVLTGGPLLGTYRLEQFHCHWGCNSGCGSEHTVNGQMYAGELHFVHWNTSKYSSFAEAATKDDGLAVLGVFLSAGPSNEELDKVVSLLPEISFRGDSVAWRDDLNVNSLLPESRGFWNYQGSLTTPPCTESVTWIVYKEPITLSEQQLESFRTLRCINKDSDCPCDQQCIINNYRPPLPLGNRELREYGS